jgi:hypothetical protein
MAEPDNPDDSREFERKDILFSARLYVGKDGFDCEIVNISFGGAQIRLGKALNNDDMVVLEIEPFGSFNMEVRWSDGKDAGIRFDDDPAKVAELVMAIATYA